MLLGIEDRVAHHEDALDLMQLLLERLDAEVSLVQGKETELGEH